MLHLANIEVMYASSILVLRGVSLDLEKGSIVSLLGSNGAGKTTTLKAISGLLSTELGEVAAGSIEYNGKKIEKMGPEAIARMGILQVMEGRSVLEHLTVEENLVLAGYSQKSKTTKTDLEKVYDYFPKLKDIKNMTSGFLSGGEQRMLVIGRAMMGHPEIMLLDEPSLGLAPLVVKEIFRIIKRLNEEENATILLVEQNAKAALGIADYGYVMENGRIVLDGSASELSENEDIKEFYLGLSAVGKKKSYKDVRHYKRRKRWL